MNWGEWNTVFGVPVSVVDKHLKTASSVYIKVLLFILRNTGTRQNTLQIAQAVGITADEVTEAVRYWESAGLFSFGSGEGMRISNVSHVTDKPLYASPSEISQLMDTKPELRFMFDRLEQLYGRPVTSTEQRSYIYLHEAAGLPADVLVMIAEHCVQNGKLSIRYIEKTALAWADEGIDTHEKAIERISRLSEAQRAENSVKRCFGIDNRNLSSKEKEYVRSWTKDYHFDMEMIELAYNRMVDGIGRLSFPYINTILKSWFENGILTPEDVAKADKDIPKRSVRKSKERGSAPSYDTEAFRRLGYDIPDIEPEK